MIHDSTPYHALNISELTRFIASQLVLTGAEKSAVNLACACRSLEEPVLSTLWERQCHFFALLKVFPEGTWELQDYEDSELCGRMVRRITHWKD